jgi:hypothetical protein
MVPGKIKSRRRWQAGEKNVPISGDSIGETQIGNPGFNGRSNEEQIDQCQSGGWTRSDHSGCEYLSIPMTDAHLGGNLVTAPAWPVHPVWLAKSLQVLVRSVAEKAAGV